MINEKRLLERFLEYIQIDSESGGEGAFAGRLKEEFGKMGIAAAQDRAGEHAGNLFVSIPGNEEQEPLLFTAHMDTVVPGRGICPKIQDGLIFSGGDTILGGDDKSGIAAVMEAVQVITERGLDHRPIEILFTVQEETGLNGSRGADLSAVRSRYSLAVDGCGPMDEIVTVGAGQANIGIEITGRAAHAGNSPEQGVSAIMAAADAVSSMRLLKIDEETTANIGSIMADNPTNIVCSHVKMAAEVRSRSKEKLDRQVRHMRDCVENACKKHGAGFRFDTTYPYASFRVEDEAFLGLVRSAYERMGVQCKCGATMVGSDSNILNEKGIISIVIPTGMTNPHALTEQISVEDLKFTAGLMLELMAVS